ncbi:DUF3853 family protein [Elizabethkingia anophelis]|uniref:DUF3853 family protein n=1 Tax=Elizabethkingia anophelis TaxID=1117645 RepID=UPI0024E22A65|nr:DUF3853 family protein [Elizabethkingia anophelis]CAH1145350.1 hypothetical protein EAVVTKC53_01936 [Elizabethkingia anophelis]CAI9679643.1 hypothetical protein EAVVTKC53_01067 [Elizabethkingia anophelis]
MNEKEKRENLKVGLKNEKSIDPTTPLWQISVGEFLELQHQNKADKRYEYGLKGIAKIFGCSVSQANRIKGSGIIDEAIIQNGNIIIIETEKALQLFGEKKKKNEDQK